MVMPNPFCTHTQSPLPRNATRRDAQELFDLVRTATDSAAAGKEGAGGRAARPSTVTARASTATTALPLAYDPCDPGFGGVDVYEQQPEPLATAAATARTARGRLPSVTLAGTPAAGRTLRSASAAASTTPAALRTPAASRRLDPSLYPATSTINASFTAGRKCPRHFTHYVLPALEDR